MFIFDHFLIFQSLITIKLECIWGIRQAVQLSTFMIYTSTDLLDDLIIIFRTRLYIASLVTDDVFYGHNVSMILDVWMVYCFYHCSCSQDRIPFTHRLKLTRNFHWFTYFGSWPYANAVKGMIRFLFFQQKFVILGNMGYETKSPKQ